MSVLTQKELEKYLYQSGNVFQFEVESPDEANLKRLKSMRDSYTVGTTARNDLNKVIRTLETKIKADKERVQDTKKKQEVWEAFFTVDAQRAVLATINGKIIANKDKLNRDSQQNLEAALTHLKLGLDLLNRATTPANKPEDPYKLQSYRGY